MGKQINHKYIIIWGLIALTAVVLIITGTSFAGSTSFSSNEGDCGPLAQEAEAGNLHGEMQVGSENGVSYIFTPKENGHHNETPHPDNRADFCVSVSQSGTYALQAVTDAEDMKQDSLWVVLNGQSFLWDTGFGKGFNQQPITDRQNKSKPVEVELSAGQYVISFHQREAGAKLDRFELVPTSFEAEPTAETPDENIGGQIPGGAPICGPLRQEAEQATLFGQMKVGERQDASGGKFIYVPKSVGHASSPQDGNHRAEFCISIPQDGNYQIKANADAPDNGSDSVWVTIDNAPSNGYLWQPRKGDGFQVDLVHDRGVTDPQIMYLTKGDHVLNFHHREPNTMIDWFEVEQLSGGVQPIQPTATSLPATSTVAPPAATTVPATATPDAECESLMIEAESGSLHGDFAIGEDNQAGGGKYIFIPNSKGHSPNGKFDRNNRADFCVKAPHSGEYQIMAWAKAPDAQHDSFFVTVDGSPASGYIWDVKKGNDFVNSYVSDRGKSDRLTLNLSEGKHIISFHRRESGTLLDKFEVIPLSGPSLPVEPTKIPTSVPTSAPTLVPTSAPTLIPTQVPTVVPPTPTEPANGGYPIAPQPTATSLPTEAPPVGSTCSSNLTFEAESGELKGVFAIGSNNAASGNKFIEIPNDAGHAPNGKIDFSNSASYCVNITSAGTYKVLARSWAADIQHDSFFVQVDGAPAAGHVWDVKNGSTFIDDYINDRGKTDPTAFYLSEGEHTITFYRREAATKLDKFEFINTNGGGAPIQPTATNVPPTATSVPPTATNVPPVATATSIPPTAAPTEDPYPGPGNPPATATASPNTPTPTSVPPTPTPTNDPYPGPGNPTATPVPGNGGGSIPATLLNPTDISFNNASWSGNPFDLIAVVTFTHHGTGLKRRTEMFYDGDNVWKARFTPDRTGKWTYSTQSGDSDLNGKTGSVQVSGSSAKGFVKANGDKWTRSATGEAFVPQFVMLGELDDFHNDPNKLNNDLNNFMNGHGFNGVHIRGYCRWFLLETDQCNYIPSNKRNPDMRTFETVEKIIMDTYARGGTTHIWMYGDNMRKHNPGDWGFNGTDDQRMQRYFAARLGALPGWTMGYGYDVFEWADKSQIETWYNYIDSRMMYSHLMGARGAKNQIMQYTEVLSYSGYEQHRPDYNTYVDSMNDRPNKPSFSEDRFRVRFNSKTKDYSLDDTRQGMYRSAMAGGVANIWGNLAASDLPSPGSVTYPNKAELKNYSDFFRGRFTTDVELCGNLSDGACLKRPTDKHFLFYKENTSSIQVNLSGMSGSQPFVAMNTKTGQQISGTFQANQQTWSAPSQSDWVIAVGNW